MLDIQFTLNRKYKFIFYIIIIISLPFLYLNLQEAYTKIKFISQSHEASAVIIDFTKTRGENLAQGNKAFPILQYQPSNDNNTVTAVNNFSVPASYFQVKQNVDILYHPDNAASVMIDNSYLIWETTSINIFMNVLLILLALWCLSRIKKRSASGVP